MYLQNSIEKMSEKNCKLYKITRYAFIRPYKIVLKTRKILGLLQIFIRMDYQM